MSVSKAQREVLEALAGDPKNRWIRESRHAGLAVFTPALVGVGKSISVWGRVHGNTLKALLKRGYVEHFEKEKAPWWAKDYRITEAGMKEVAGDQR